MSSPTLIDDSQPAVQYSPGWIWDQLVHDEVDHTRHGAAISNLTASLGFTGIGIEVVGTLEPTDRNGLPTTTYSIDGKVIETYTAPVTSSGDTQFNVTFFSKRDLDPGNHQIVVTNINGSSPNIFWLDYFLIYDGGSEGGSSGTTVSSSSSSVASSPTSPSSDGSSAGSNVSGASGSNNHVGAIVGGVIGALALLVLIGIFWLLWRRDKRRARQDVTQFAHAPAPAPQPYSSSTIPPSTLILASSSPDLGNTPEMSSASSAIASRPPMSATESSNYATTLSDVTSAHAATNLTTTSTALASSNVMPLTPQGFTRAQLKLQESIYGSSTSASVSRSATSGAQSETQLTSATTESPVTPATSVSETPLVHAEVSRAPWYAPAERQGRAESLLRAFSMRNSPTSGARAQTPVHDVDSGLRLYNEPALPPPYSPN